MIGHVTSSFRSCGALPHGMALLIVDGAIAVALVCAPPKRVTQAKLKAGISKSQCASLKCEHYWTEGKRLTKLKAPERSRVSRWLDAIACATATLCAFLPGTHRVRAVAGFVLIVLIARALVAWLPRDPEAKL